MYTRIENNYSSGELMKTPIKQDLSAKMPGAPESGRVHSLGSYGLLPVHGCVSSINLTLLPDLHGDVLRLTQ